MTARYEAFSFVFFQAALREGAQAIFPFRRLFKGKMGILPGRLLGTITKEKGPYDPFSFGSYKAALKGNHGHQEGKL